MPAINSSLSTNAPGLHVLGWVAVALAIPIFVVFCYLLSTQERRQSTTAQSVTHQITSRSPLGVRWPADACIQLRVEKEEWKVDYAKLNKTPRLTWFMQLFRRPKEPLLPTHRGLSTGFAAARSFSDCLRLPPVQPLLPPEVLRVTIPVPVPVAFSRAETVRLSSSFPPLRQQAVEYRAITAPDPADSLPISALFGTSDFEPIIKELEDYASLVKALSPPVVKPAKSDLPGVDTVAVTTNKKESAIEISDLFGISNLEPLIKELEDYASLVRALPVPVIQPPKPDSPSTKLSEHQRNLPADVITTTTKTTTKTPPQRSSTQKNAMKENESQSSRPSKHSGPVAKHASAAHVPPSALSSVVSLASSTNSSSTPTATVQIPRSSCLSIGSPSAGSKAVPPSVLKTCPKNAKSVLRATVVDAVPVPFVHLAYQPRDRTPKWRSMEEVIVESAEELPVEELYPPLRRNFQFPSLVVVSTPAHSVIEDDSLDNTSIRGSDWWPTQLKSAR